jgi:hypothetical protein
LTELRLDGCTSCEEFPQFGQFKALEVLILKRLNKLQSLCSRSSSAAFPALKSLALKNLDIFERWVATGEELTFPLLENVNIKNCPKLATLPEARKLKVIKLKEDKAQLSSLIFRSRHMSCLSEIFLSVSDTEATPELKLDQDPEVSISVTRLRGCTFLFPSSPLQPTVEVWKWFGQLVDLKLEYCDVLISWPEEEFQSLVSLNNLSIQHCSKLIGPTRVKGYCTRGRDQLLPNLRTLSIFCCESLKELFVLPPSLMDIDIQICNSLEFISGQDDRELDSLKHLDTAASSENFNDLASTSMPEQLASPKINHLPCLETLKIWSCKKLRVLSVHSDALLHLSIMDCNVLDSLDFLGDLPLLEKLRLWRCQHLASLPGSRGNYSALQDLTVGYCPAINMKPIYGLSQHQLDRLEQKDTSNACSSEGTV